MSRPAWMLSILATVAFAGDELDRHPWTSAVESTNRAYVVETNTFPEVATSLADRLTAAYTFFEDRFGPLLGKARRPMRVSLFRNTREYLAVGDGVEGAVGHFDAALDRCVLAWRGELGDEGWPVAVHEACHHYLRRRHPEVSLPSWYAEGMPCYFEGVLDPTAEHNLARLRVHTAVDAVRRGEARLRDLLHTRAQVRAGRLLLHDMEPARFYALAWSLVHFLASDADMRDGFRRFELRLFAARPTHERREALAQRLLEDECGDLDALDAKWQAHVRAMVVPVPPPSAAVYAWELAADRPYVRYAALRRLHPQPVPADLRDGVRRALFDRDIIVRAAAVDTARTSMHPDFTGGLVAALDVGDAHMKSAAMRALAHRCAVDAVPRLLRETEDREGALRALSASRDARAYPTLRAALRDPRLPVPTRARCAAALEGDDDAAADLRAAATDPDRPVRNAAYVALMRIVELRLAACVG
jgi:hypothetical protein